MRTTLTIEDRIARNLKQIAHRSGKLAALALEEGWTLVSTDNDFRRFSGLPVLNPVSD